MDLKLGKPLLLDSNKFKQPDQQPFLLDGKYRSPEDNEDYRPDEVAAIMKGAGFAPSIVNSYRLGMKEIVKNDSDRDPINKAYHQYYDVMVRMGFMYNYTHTMANFDPYGIARQELDGSIFNAENYLAKISTDFDVLCDHARDLLSNIREVDVGILSLADPDNLVMFEQFLKSAKYTTRGFQRTSDARFGYWMTDAISDLFILDPSLRGKLHNFVYQNRKKILSDYLPIKIKAAEQFLNFINQIDDFNNADIYRQELTNRTNHIIERYTKTDETLHEVLDYKPDCVSLSTPPKTSGRTTALEVQTAEPTSIKTPLLDWSSARPIDPKATITPPQPKPNEPSAAEISRRVETAKIEWTKHQQIEAAKAAREAAELAELEKQLKELEEQEQKNQIPEREEEVEDTVEKLYKSGDRVKFIDIPKEPTATIDKNDEDFIKKQKLAEITRAKRKYNMKDAGECHGAEELVILKSTAKRKNRSQKEAYMVLLKSNTGDKNDDIVMLDGDSTGVAAYIARRSAILDAIELAGVQEKVQAQKQREGKKATEYDYLHFLMKCCRSEMRQCDARYVIHHPNKDIALEFDQIIEQLRPPVGEISVPREI